MSTEGVNIPLLRKAVEWAEAEATKPDDLREWEQNYYSHIPLPGVAVQRVVGKIATRDVFKSADCGTCYCIAGYAAMICDLEPGMTNGAEALGLNAPDACELFHEANTIEDIRRIAERIAGESL